jgi:8-hydroxy-5-deazaflavin:NADPH oxidoreductase
MKIGIIGTGHIGGNVARLLSAAGHEVVVSFSRDPAALDKFAGEIGATSGSPAEAAHHADVVVLSVPWGTVDEAVTDAGGAHVLAGKIVIDTTNQYGRVNGKMGILDLDGASGGGHNAAKVPGAIWVKAFNTLASATLEKSAGKTGPDRVVLFYGTNDDNAATVMDQLITDAGFDPVRTGTLDRNEVGHQEPPGDFYNKVLHHDDAITAVEKLRGTPPPPPK